MRLSKALIYDEPGELGDRIELVLFGHTTRRFRWRTFALLGYALSLILLIGTAAYAEGEPTQHGGQFWQALKFLGAVGDEEPLFDPLAGLGERERLITHGLLMVLPYPLLEGRTMETIRQWARDSLRRAGQAEDRWGVKVNDLDLVYFVAYPTALDEPVDWPPLEKAWQQARGGLVPQPDLTQMVVGLTQLAVELFPATSQPGKSPSHPPSSAPWPTIKGDWCAGRSALLVRLLRRVGIPTRVVWTGPVEGFPQGYSFVEMFDGSSWLPLDPCGKGVAGIVAASGAVYRPYPSPWGMVNAPYLAWVEDVPLSGFTVELATQDYTHLLNSNLVEVSFSASGPNGEPLPKFLVSVYGNLQGEPRQVAHLTCRIGYRCQTLLPSGNYLVIWQGVETLWLERNEKKEKEGAEPEFLSIPIQIAQAKRVEIDPAGQHHFTAQLNRGDPELPSRIWLGESER